MKERDLIATINAVVGKGAEVPRDLLMGIGDDCAVVAGTDNRVWLLSVDTLVEMVHFDPAFHPPEQLGRKAVSVNVSDIAAMGGEPKFLLLSLGIASGDTGDNTGNWLERFTRGFVSACQDYGCLLIGGDTVQSRESVISVTVIGEMDRELVCYRHGAQEGDLIWVSGALGRAAAGLALCQEGRFSPGRDQEYAELINAHLDPVARIKLGRLLATSGLVHCMMDVSDGPATDLAHICRQSKLGARLEAHRLPLSSEVERVAKQLGLDPLQLMLAGGEDYELLFTTAAGDAQAVERLTAQAGYTIYQIGRMVRGNGVQLVVSDVDSKGKDKVVDITYQGYDHFTAHHP